MEKRRSARIKIVSDTKNAVGSQEPTNLETLRAALEWIVQEGIFKNITLHGNTAWLPDDLVVLAVLWVWSDNAIREIASRHGAAMNAWQNADPQACREFRDAEGDIEFTTDGASVNTTNGWHEMKLAIFSKRQPGEAATPKHWSDRTLPAPESRVAFAAIERSGRFGRRWKQWARRLGILDTSNVTVLADGAKWIWEEQLNHLRGAEGFWIFSMLWSTSPRRLVACTERAAAKHRSGWPKAGQFC